MLNLLRRRLQDHSARASRNLGVARGSRWFIFPATICALVVAANLADLYGNDLGHGLRLLDANWQFSWSHNLDTAMLGVGLLAAIAGSRGAPAERKLWYSTAVILGMFFLDEATPLHATIDQLWFGKFLYVPILVGLVVVLWLLAAESDQWMFMAVGLGTLLLSFGLHVLGVPRLRALGYFNGIYQVAVGLKEGLESAGLVLIVPSLWRLAARARRQLLTPGSSS